MIVSSSATTRRIEDVAAQLNCALPKAFAEELAAARALVPAASELEGMTGRLQAAGITALREGRDPGVDAEVQRLATLVTLANTAGIRHAANEYANDAITAAVVTHADTILAAWAKAISADLEVLEDAADQLDDIKNLNDAEPLLLKRNNLLSVWAEATTAADRADLALSGLNAILAILAVRPDPEYRVLFLAPDCAFDDYIAANALAGPRNVNAWTTARTGAPLRLIGSVAEFSEAAARINATQHSRARQRDNEELTV